MKDLTLIIPTKEEVESLPVFIEEIKKLNCKKLIVLQEDDIETKAITTKAKGSKCSICWKIKETACDRVNCAVN